MKEETVIEIIIDTVNDDETECMFTCHSFISTYNQISFRNIMKFVDEMSFV